MSCVIDPLCWPNLNFFPTNFFLHKIKLSNRLFTSFFLIKLLIFKWNCWVEIVIGMEKKLFTDDSLFTDQALINTDDEIENEVALTPDRRSFINWHALEAFNTQTRTHTRTHTLSLSLSLFFFSLHTLFTICFSLFVGFVYFSSFWKFLSIPN